MANERDWKPWQDERGNWHTPGTVRYDGSIVGEHRGLFHSYGAVYIHKDQLEEAEKHRWAEKRSPHTPAGLILVRRSYLEVDGAR